MFIGVTTEGFVFLPQRDEVEARQEGACLHLSGEFAYLSAADGAPNGVASIAAGIPLRGDVIVCGWAQGGALAPLTAQQVERAGGRLTEAAVARINSFITTAA